MILLGEKVWPFRGMTFAHLTSDTSMEELHEFAARCGSRREWFQGDHYDVTGRVYAKAVQLGAKKVTDRECAAVVRVWRKKEAERRKASGG